ncbi:MAG: BtpA/SgcQ family protein [Planctomycetes bacterium]|nr:BtpA/SgcQ family protein [Planctomycetota bacterium]
MSIVSSRNDGRKIILGVVHLLPLPGSPRGMRFIAAREAAERDADRLLEGGCDGFIVENFGDTPFVKGTVEAAVVAAMAIVVESLRKRAGDGPLLGVNVLRNDAIAALSIAHCARADFIRVNVHTGVQFTDQGMIEGTADRTLRERQRLGSSVEILADVAVKHAVPPAGFDLEASAIDTARRGLADGLIVTGRGTGEATDLETVQRVRRVVPAHPLFVGSGVRSGTIVGLLGSADGVIVGTSLKEDGEISRPVSAARVRELVGRVRG